VINFPGYKRDANQNNTTFHLTPVRMAIIKGYNKTNAGKDVVKQESLYTACRNAN
jgi:hypothetical protein